MSEVAAEINVQVGEKRERKRSSGKRSNALDMTIAEAELITKGLTSAEDVDGMRTTRSSTRVLTAASKLKCEPPAKKEKKSSAVEGGEWGSPKVSKEESDEVLLSEENGISELDDVDSKADYGGSSTEEEVDSKTEERVENGNSSVEKEKKVDESEDFTNESDKPAVTVEVKNSNP